MTRTIVVGVDSSEHAQRALTVASQLAAEGDREVVAVHAVGLLADPSIGQVPVAGHEGELSERLHRWCAPLRKAGVRWRCRLEAGEPVAAISRVADELDAFLIIVGSRGEGGFSGLHLGSTSHQLAQYAAHPVVIVPPLHRMPPGIDTKETLP